MTSLPGAELGAAWRHDLADPTPVPLDAAGCAAPSARVLAAAGFALRRWWTDAAGDFGVALATRT